MKFFHLSDLHLGRRIHEFSLLDDQRFILNQILSLVREEQPDGVLLAGDIYDKPVPPSEAVRLFDQFLTDLSGLSVSVFVISGNHDSAQRLAFGADLMRGSSVYVSPVYDGQVRQVRLTDSYGPVMVHLLPFLRPAAVRHALGDEEIDNSQKAAAAALSHMEIDRSCRNILVAHQFVTGAGRCESEEIPVGGLDSVEAALFDAFDYVALGHLHSPQTVGEKRVRYCGTPLKYSFSEAEQTKSVTVIELREKGEFSQKELPLTPLRDMRKLRGSYQELTARSFYEGFNREDYIHITLTEEEDILDGMTKLRVIYPNLMQLEYDNQRTRNRAAFAAAENVEAKSEQELFEELYEMQNNQPMSGEQKAFVRRLIEELKEKRLEERGQGER